jgi:cytochrome c oxidase subunit 4
MSTDTHTHAHEEAGDHAEHGMSTRGYVNIAIILALITALEVATYYVDFGPFFLPSLLVVSYFMHLKFDNKIFSFLFYSGLVLAIGVYVAFLATFHFFIR